MPLSKANRGLYLYSSSYNFKNIATELNIQKKTVSKFIKKVTNVFNYLDRNEIHGKLGEIFQKQLLKLMKLTSYLEEMGEEEFCGVNRFGLLLPYVELKNITT
ncbi:hypothetical protein COBT_002460 [Conglomerata obtusa]